MQKYIFWWIVKIFFHPKHKFFFAIPCNKTRNHPLRKQDILLQDTDIQRQFPNTKPIPTLYQRYTKSIPTLW